MSERDQSAVNDAIELAVSAADDRICLLRACRKIVLLRGRLGAVPGDILDPIVAVESELDGVPDAADASLWESGAFRQKRRERDEYLEKVRPALLRSFRELAEYLRPESPSG